MKTPFQNRCQIYSILIILWSQSWRTLVININNNSAPGKRAELEKSYVRTATRSTLKVEANLTQILHFKANFHTEFEPFFYANNVGRTTMEISRIYLLFVQSLAIYVIMFNIESLYCILLNKIKSKTKEFSACSDFDV